MTQPARFTSEAAAELEEAAHWYEQRHTGFGLAFIDAVDRAVETLARWPDTGTPISGLPAELPARRVPVARFPFYVVYLASADGLHVLAIAHERRRPAYWSGRAMT